MAKIRVFFSGMCLNVLNGTNPDRSRAGSLDVVMLNGITTDGFGFRHHPTLTIPQGQIEPGSVVDRVIATRSADGDAQYYGVIDLSGFDCRLEFSTPPQQSGIVLNQTPLPENGLPETDDEWASLHLVADPAKAAGQKLAPMSRLVRPTNGADDRHRAVQSTFNVSHGTFSAAKPAKVLPRERWLFYPGEPQQVFADSTVVTFESDAVLALVGEGFGDRRGRAFRVGLGVELEDGSRSNVDVFVANVPIQQLGGFDANDFLPFGDVLDPPTAIPPHQPQSGGDPVYCMSAICYN